MNRYPTNISQKQSVNIYESIKSCKCLAKSECIYQGYDDCMYEYLQEEIPDWYYEVEPYKSMVK